MSQTIRIESQTALAALPPETWLTFDHFGHLLPGFNRRKWQDASKSGRTVPGTRFTNRSTMVFRAGDVLAWMRAREAEVDALAAGRTVVPFDETNSSQPSHKTIKAMVTGGSAVVS